MKTTPHAGHPLVAVLIAVLGLESGHFTATAQTTFEPILGTRFADHITPDGRVVVGRIADVQFAMRAARWTREGGLENWGGNAGHPVYTEGSGTLLAAGDQGDWYNITTNRWTGPNDWEAWGPIIRGLSVDARTVAFTENNFGEGWFGSYVLRDGVRINAPYYPDVTWQGSFYVDLRDITDDGGIVVGSSLGRAFTWRPGEQLVRVGPGEYSGTATAIARGSDSEQQPWVAGIRNGVWVESPSGELLVMPPIAGRTYVLPSAISNDGKMVYVNETNYYLEDSAFNAFLWIPGSEAIPLDAVLSDTLPQGWHILGVYDSTADGRTIVGQCIDPLGGYHGFIATIPAPPTALAGLLGLFLCRTRRRRTAIAL